MQLHEVISESWVNLKDEIVNHSVQKSLAHLKITTSVGRSLPTRQKGSNEILHDFCVRQLNCSQVR